MKADLQKTALLARLSCDAEKMEKLSAKAEAILKYIEKLNALPTEQVSPTAHAVDLQNAFREDVVAPFAKTEEILAAAPEREDDPIGPGFAFSDPDRE